jgi:hypothetical protein
MAFLRLKDYTRQIRQDNLDKILLTDDRIRTDKEADVIEHVKGYLRHRYDVNRIFIDIIPFSLSAKFYPNDLIEYAEPVYSVDAAYEVGDRVSYSFTENGVTYNFIYECIAIPTDELPTDEDFWKFICENGELFTCVSESLGNYPDSEVSYSDNDFVARLDLVRGWDKTLNPTLYFRSFERVLKIYVSDEERIADYNSVGMVSLLEFSEVPSLRPILRGSHRNNQLRGELWIKSRIPENTNWEITATDYFTKKDIRNRQIKQYCIDITLFELHKLINPRNFPEIRVIAKDTAVEELEKIQRGKITPDLPIYETRETKGEEISWGNTDSRNYYY